MAQIIEFRRRDKKEEMSRTEALVKGKIDVYRCDSCGKEFEVINDVFPDTCPGCGVVISVWNDSEESK